QGPFYFRSPDRYTYTGSLSYVTGTHAFKSGLQWGTGGNRHQRSLQNGVDLIQEYRNGAPVSVQTYNTTQWSAERIKYDLGLYVQDSWTMNRLTLNPGLRMEFFNTYIPQEGASPGRLVPQWEYSVGGQRELVRGVSVSANWVRRSWRRLIWTDNTLVSFDDYTIVNTTNPINPSELIPIYNLRAAKLGQVTQIDKNSDQNQK